MKFALFLVLSLSAMAFAGPAFNKNNQINQQQQQQQQQQNYMTGVDAKSAAIDVLKQWCFSSQMSQQELTASFKKLVNVVKSSPVDQTTESAVMGERICQGALVQKSQQTGQTYGQTGADAKAHELIKDVYMDALISCKSRECTQQLLKVISSQQVDAVRASYYMTRIAVTDKESMKDEQEVKQFAESFIQQSQQSEAVERQKLFATTALIGKWIQAKPSDAQIKEVAQKVAQTIVERYVKEVSEQEVEQYKQSEQPSAELAKKIAKRNAALKALANIPGHVLKQNQECEQTLIELAKRKDELVTVRQSAIECLEQNDKQMQLLKQLTFDQEEPIEVRVAAYRALMSVTYQPEETSEAKKEQMAQQIVEQIVKHCEEERNQQQDDQFVLYAISHLDNVRTSQQPEHQAIKETIAKNKQHFMQIQVLARKFKQQLSDVRRASRNYKLEQEFNQLESGLVLEGDIIFESKQHKQQQQQQILPKLVRVNMSMPIMGETVNVIELTLRQNQMDEEILSALKLVQNAKFSSQSVSKVVDTFKSSVEKQQIRANNNNNNKQVEADLTIKVDGCTVVYVCVDDIKAAAKANYRSQAAINGQHERQTRSIYAGESIFEQAIEFLKRQPISFNRGFNLNINERLAKVLDVEANILAGLRFESRAASIGSRRGDFELAVHMEPRFGFEAVVGPAKVSSKKLLQRISTKSALGMRLRFKQDELVDVELELPMDTMELFTIESQLVEKSRSVPHSYTYLPESIYGQEDIYSVYPSYTSAEFGQKLVKRSVSMFGESWSKKKSIKSIIGKLIDGKQVAHSFESSDEFARTTGLRGKLRVAVAPKDMGVFVSCMVQKYEPSMQGYRVKVEKVVRQADLKQYQVTVSTPGSRIERTMMVRVVKQSSNERTLIKAEFQSARIAFAHIIELVHDQRQYALKTELVSRAGPQWRHALECGLLQGAQAASGRLAQFAYRPYLQLDSTYLKRPVQLQGQIAYQQSPKSVISYELKCATTGDFVQGKLIVDTRDVGKLAYRKRASAPFRRSMQSPIELAMSMDVTLTNELIAQVQQRSLKVHNMVDWSSQKYNMEADTSVVYKNLRKPTEDSQLLVSAKLNEQIQTVSLERKCANDQRNNYILKLVSQVRPTGHQMELECRFNERRQSLIAYKHKVEVQKIAANKYETKLELALVDTERNLDEKFIGRARIQNERKQKAIDCELVSGAKSAKLIADFQSMSQHQIQLQLQCERFQHKTELRNNQRQFVMQSRTDDKLASQTLAKMLVELQKPADEIKVVLEAPVKRASLAADLKLVSGKRSSVALQTGRFVSQAEFSFNTIARPFIQNSRLFQNNLRFRSNLKDLVKKQAYWMDSAINAAELDKETSFIRFDSPIYRTELEFEPRESLAKFGTFARTKRSVDHFDQAAIYSTKESPFSFDALTAGLNQKLSLGPNKLWMLRSIISSPYGREQLKREARRALFQYADRRASHQHQLKWSPMEQRISMDLLREPNSEFVSHTAASFEPTRAKAELSTSWSRPSSMSLESEWMNVEGELKPFTLNDDNEESYARFSALSRHPRSAFKKHESEFRYNKHQGYKAAMKHEDAQNKKHSWQLESDAEPSKYTKMMVNSEKHGKASWEHKWRKEQHKRASDDEPVYKNKFALIGEGPAHNKWQHETTFDWEEPISMVNKHYGRQQRHRRSYNIANNDDDDDNNTDYEQTSIAANWPLVGAIYAKLADAGRYSPIDYLKHTSARLQSQQTAARDQLYKLHFDYQPHQNFARLNVDMPQEMLHSSELEIKPAEQLYKLQSRLLNKLTKEPSYEFIASSKPYALASADQEPVFVQSEHPMLERPISKESLVYSLMKQPMKIDYSDKDGRKIALDYDQSPIMASASTTTKFAGLRQKRAALYYKDAANDFEHTSTYDFYPETLMGQMKPAFYKQQQQKSIESPRDIAFKTQTKYGPLMVRADSSDDTLVLALESPVIKAKLVGETGANMRQLFKLELDNKSQRVQLAKLLRDAPESIRENELVKKVARKFDSGRFEHQTELLVSIVDQIFKVKSASKFNERPALLIEGEWNEQQNKAFVKVDGERVNGQAVIDLVRKSAELVLDVDDKRTVHHVTRLVRTSDKFYALESVTTHKSRPVLKLVGKISAMIFDTEHLFARRRYLEQQQEAGHVSTFEATIYEPNEYHVRGQFDCDKKEARIVFKNADEQKQQETLLRFDDETDTLFVDARLNSQHQGQIYAAKAKLNLPGLYQAYECQSRSATKVASCQSELIYADKSGNYAAKYAPGEYVTVSGPHTKQTINLAGYYY